MIGLAVKTFMKTMGQDTPDQPYILSPSEWELRTDLIAEEAKELEEAYKDGDLAGFLDACVDLVYVVVGTAVAAGLPFDKAFERVHDANMAKASKCGCSGGCDDCNHTGLIVHRRADGKILKPSGWQAPDIESLIEDSYVRYF